MHDAYIEAIKGLPQASHITKERLDAWLQVYLANDKMPLSPDKLASSLSRFSDAEGGVMLREWLCQRQHPDFQLDYSDFDSAKVIDQKMLLAPPFILSPQLKREMTFRSHIRDLYIEYLNEQGKDVQRDLVAADAISAYRNAEIPSLSTHPHDVFIINGERYGIFTRIPSDPQSALYSQLSFSKQCQHQVVMKAAELAGYPLAGVIVCNYNMLAHSFIEHQTAPNQAIMNEVGPALNDGWRRVVENCYPDKWDYEDLNRLYPQLSIDDIEAVRRFTLAKGIRDYATKLETEASEQLKGSLTVPVDPTEATTHVSLGPVEYTRRTKTVINEQKLLAVCTESGLDPKKFIVQTKYDYDLEAMRTAVSNKLRANGKDADTLINDCQMTQTTTQVQLTRKKTGAGSRISQAMNEVCREQMDAIFAKLDKQMSSVESHWTDDYLSRSARAQAQASQLVVDQATPTPTPTRVAPDQARVRRHQVQNVVTFNQKTIAEAREIATNQSTSNHNATLINTNNNDCGNVIRTNRRTYKI
ncbi:MULTISPECIES: hypothetical protein [Aeromonas]|uniref:hypothetical protein n=1 Tax=Aeromonas TaxID=642 RepID=UPI002B053AEE|nr:hypothetical protein [Aeromonas jandaei]